MGALGGLIDRVSPPGLGSAFRRFLGAAWLSNLGDGILLAAGPLLVAEQTTSAAVVALAAVLQRVPWFIFGLGAGIVADRLDRRALMMIGHGARLLLLVVLAVAIAGGQIGITLVLVALFMHGVAETFADVATDATVPMIVPDEHLGIANARVTFGFAALNHLAGPPLGAILFAAAMWVPFLAQAALLGAAVLLVSRLALPPVEREPSGSAIGDLVEGIKWLWQSAPVRTLAITIFVFNITWGATHAIQVLYAIERLELEARGFGLFLAMGAIGGVIGTVIYGWLEARFSLGGMMRVGLTLETFTHAAFALTRNWVVAFAIMFVFGLQASVWGTTGRAVRQRAVPDELQGRVGSVYLFSVQTGLVIGGVVGGAVAALFGIVAVYWYAFVGSGLLVAAVWRELPHIAHAETATTAR